MSRPTDTHWTYEDLLQLPDEGTGTRNEIIGGERFMTPSPFEPHQRASGNLYFLLRQFVEPRELGEVYHAALDVILSDDTVLIPDLVFVSKARVNIIEERGVVAAPDLVVEILSKGTKRRDLGVKLDTYGAHGVREYWVVDPERQRIEVFTLERRRLVRRAAHDSGEVEALAALPGFRAPLDRIFGKPPGSRRQ